jgi:energy-coupling factor transporter ATP-binding protein EcfA2
MASVGLSDIPLNIPPSALSGGQQRRLALAIQLVRAPSLLLLDEPLSGLDWRARAEVVELLRRVKERCTLVVVSHDLREIAPLVDVAWRMRMGGAMEAVPGWDPGALTSLEEEGREPGAEAAARDRGAAGGLFL